MNVSSGDGKGGDVDLNLAPIIDCFTVLIIFLLASASFLSIGILSVSAALPGQGASQEKPPSITVEVELTTKNDVKIHVTGKTKVDRSIASKAGEINTTDLMREVEGLQAQWPDTKGLILSAEDEVPYSQVVRVMELARVKFPAILLGGFK
jgi:biopolymer transport protein ExbD